jgi:phosphoserine phosphatase
MNLVISGPIDDSLRNTIVAVSAPRNVVKLHAAAYRLEGADDSAAVRIQVLALCDSARVDQAYIAEGLRFSDFKLLAMDMDSTLITIECIDEIADFAGKKKEVAAITEAAMRGEITDFAESLRRRVALLAGTPATILDRVFSERLQLSPGAQNLVQAAQAARLHTLLLSGGFTFFTTRLQARLSLSEAHANNLEIKNGLITGRVFDPILDSNAKENYVEQAKQRLSCTSNQTIAIGDGANDLAMMSRAGFSVAFHAKPIVQNAATNTISFGPLSVLNDWLQ